MTTKKNPTNLDIYKLLGEHTEELKQIHHQVLSTNGRVSKLEQWKSKLDNIAEYKRENPPPQMSSSDRAEGWSSREKTLTAIITALIAIIAALAGAGKLP